MILGDSTFSSISSSIERGILDMVLLMLKYLLSNNLPLAHLLGFINCAILQIQLNEQGVSVRRGDCL